MWRGRDVVLQRSEFLKRISRTQERVWWFRFPSIQEIKSTHHSMIELYFNASRRRRERKIPHVLCERKKMTALIFFISKCLFTSDAFIINLKRTHTLLSRSTTGMVQYTYTSTNITGRMVGKEYTSQEVIQR